MDGSYWRVFQKRKFLGFIIMAFWGLPFCQPLVCADTLSLDDVTEQAIQRSFTLKIAAVDIGIGKAGEKIARADYFPTIKGNLNTEYLKDLSQTPQPVVAVGSSIIPSGTRFQNSLGISTQYTLLDFGSRRRKLTMAKEDTQARSAVYFQTLRDLRLKLVDVYAQALLHYRQLKAHEALLTLAQSGYQLQKRLYKAGTHSKVEVAEEAIQVAQALDSIQADKEHLAEQLQQLSYFTQTPYDPASIELLDITVKETNGPVQVSIHQSPEARQLDARISAKQAEIEMLKRQYLPHVSMYSYYNFYGFDPDRLGQSIGNLRQRTISLGVNVSLPVFDGFKTQGQLQKAQLEQEKLKLEKEEKLAQLKQQVDLYQTQVNGRLVSLKTKATVINSTQDKLNLVERLSDSQIVDQTHAVKEHMSRIHKQMEAEKVLIEQLTALKKLQILAEG